MGDFLEAMAGIVEARASLMVDFRTCLDCLSGPPRTPITEDHMVAKYMGKVHPDVLGPVVPNRKNRAPLCWIDHTKVERQKRKKFESDGVNGIVLYLANNYPRNATGELLLVEDGQIAYILERIAENINGLNGDAPRIYKENYERAMDNAFTYCERLRREMSGRDLDRNPPSSD